jgi:hypothetical protein
MRFRDGRRIIIHRGGFEDAAVGSALASVARLDAPAPLRR